VLVACSDLQRSTAPGVSPSVPAGSLSGMTSCGASFRVIATDDDSLMAAYGIMRTVDTVDVCESWTGSDYQWEGRGVGSSDNFPELVDDIQSVSYDAGYVVGYGSSGSQAVPPVEAGPTSFDYMYADESTRQASYDYPYYGVSSPDPAACTDPLSCPALSIGPAPSSATSAPKAAIPGVPFSRHGLTRVGVRALVDGADEIAPSREGFRRFRKIAGNETTIFSVDPRTQLLVADEVASASDTTWTRHSWTRVAGGYVRSRTDMESVEVITGRRIRNRTTIVLENVRVTDPRYRTLIGPEVRP